jgi:Domain of unknown function (DUF4371)
METMAICMNTIVLHYHAVSKVKAEEYLVRIKNQYSAIDFKLDAALDAAKKENRSTVKCVAEVVLLYARLGQPFRGHRDDSSLPPPVSINDMITDEGQFRTMAQLYSLGNPIFHSHLQNGSRNATYLSKTTQSKLIACMGPVICRTIVEDIREAVYFTVLVDETTDVDHNSQLSVSVRYIFRQQIVERFLEFINPESLTRLALAADIVDVLRRARLDTNNLVGQGYEGAAAMSCEFGGVQAEVKSLCGPQAIYVHCVAYAFNLTLVKASDVLAIRNALVSCRRWPHSSGRVPPEPRNLIT